MSHTYVQELESLILDTLLPTYIRYHRHIGTINPMQGLNEDLLKHVKRKKVLPALLLPKKN